MRAGTLLTVLGGTILLASLLAASVYLWRGDGGGTAPSIPPALQPATAAELGARTDQVIDFFQERVQRDPADYASYTKLGQTYMRQARETGDIGAYDRAETALREALALNPDDPDASASLATVLFAKHDFAAALALAQQVYTADPGATQALAIIGDARLELGDYEGARDAYGFLANAASGPAVLSRQSHVADLMGDPDEAIELMEEAEARASRRGRSIEGVAWYRLQLGGLYFNTGRLDQAEPWYAAALDLFPGYSPALAGLGAVEAARGNYDEAIGLYEQAVAAVPQPSLLAALGDLYAHIGDTEAAQRQYETVEFIGQLGELNRTVYNRELALFYADHGIKTGIAVQLALAELDVRKDIYGYDAGAWALYSDGRSGEAQPLMEQALRLGTEDARLLYHAGMIALDLGQRQQARAYLEQALELNPGFSLLQTSEAQQALANLSSSNAFAEARD